MRYFLLALALWLAACAAPAPEAPARATPTLALFPGETPRVRSLVNKWADHYDVPRTLVHRIIQRESDYRARARNGPYWGMMQILPATARGVGFDGPNTDLLNADINLQWSVKYLRGAWLLADGDEERAVELYARGYYYEARDRCMLVETGLRKKELRSVCG